MAAQTRNVAASSMVGGFVAAALLVLSCHTAHAARPAGGRFLLAGGLKLRGSHVLRTSADPVLTLLPTSTCDRHARHSPYRLMYDWSASGAADAANAVHKYCFRVEHVGGCDPSERCCSGQQGLRQVEFDVEPSCQPSVTKVTVDGLEAPVEIDTAQRVLRVPNLARSAADAPGTEVCLFLDASDASACPSLRQLCDSSSNSCKYAVFTQDLDCCPSGIAGGPPLPTPVTRTATAATTGPRLPFPAAECQREPWGSRLFTTLHNSTAEGDLTKICFDVNVAATCQQPDSPCCAFDLYKLEFEVDRTCRAALAYTTVDGQRRAPFFQSDDPTAVIKVTNINKPISAAAGTEVCLFLRPQCNTLQKLCAHHDGSCAVGVFNKPSSKAPSCCPLSYVYQ